MSTDARREQPVVIEAVRMTVDEQGKIGPALTHRLCDEIEALRALLTEAEHPRESPSGWRPIESAPKERADILVGHPDGSCEVVSWSFAREEWVDSSMDRVNWPTHWMPLPGAPSEPVGSHPRGSAREHVIAELEAEADRLKAKYLTNSPDMDEAETLAMNKIIGLHYAADFLRGGGPA